jgi:hypothetical protein
MQLSNHLRKDIQELTRLASLATEAHSSAVFLPTDLLKVVKSSEPLYRSSGVSKDNSDNVKRLNRKDEEQRASSIDLVAYTSETDLVKDSRIQVGHGLLGWVSEQGKSIHLAPCDVPSSSIGIYIDSAPVKSLVAVPITIDRSPQTNSSSGVRTIDINNGPHGVLMCDSTKASGFTNKEIKILENIARAIQGFISWSLKSNEASPVETSWDLFKQATSDLGDAIGHDSIELLRLRLDSLNEIENIGGISLAVQLSDQFIRLTQQALPPHFPYSRIPDGDIVLAVDNMMSAFFQQKLQSLANHLSSTEKPLHISIESYRAKLSTGGKCNIDLTLRQQPISISTSLNIGGVRA